MIEQGPKSTRDEDMNEPLYSIKQHRISVTGQYLNYDAQPNVEGECLLTSVVPIRKSMIKYSVFVILCVLFIGIPYLLTYWYPKLKKQIYYVTVGLESATHFYVLNNDGEPSYPKKEQGEHYFTEDQSKHVTYFFNRYLKYIVDESTVTAACLDFLPRLKRVQAQASTGLKLEQVHNLRRSYGLGTMILEQKDMADLFVSEIMRPLYVFIVFSCLLWVYEEYFYYSIMIFVTAAFGIGTSLVQTYRINKKIFDMAYFETPVNILRDGQIKIGSSKYVVPGDIVFVKQPMKMPFDGILLHGSALSNQCSITGQSVPVLKKAEQVKELSDVKSSYIFEGSYLIQVNVKQKFKEGLTYFQKFRQQYGLPVYVIRTNFITTKGQLIRIISFPIQRKNVFEKQSIKFLAFLFCLTVVSYVFLVVRLYELADPLDLFVKFLDLVTVTVPPGLPVSMTFGIVFALQKMKLKSIFCTSPNKTIVGGIVNYLCFDKTGTLTEDFMDFYALLPCRYQQQEKSANFSQPILKSWASKKVQQILQQNTHVLFALNNMAVNHTIVQLDGTGEYIGDPMEVKMFEFGEFQLNDQNIEKAEVLEEFTSTRGHSGEIYRRLEFDSELFRMSTVSRSNQTGEDFFIYTKGSPQHVHNIFNNKSLPSDYNKVLKKYTCQGLRVLAIGHRLIKHNQIKLSRQQLECDLIFDGFEVFENKLKPETKSALTELVDANLPFVMITGDNALTASSIAFQCNIFEANTPAFICHYQVDPGCFTLEKFHQHQLENVEEDQIIKINTVEEMIEFVLKNKPQVCLTGKSFNHLFQSHFDQKKQLSNFLSYVKVYARAKPNDKTRIIALYQSLNKIVAMCGDGANDCGALKQADIGLSLSQAEASISAPFTSQITNVSSMIELIKECRAGLATNYSLFNIMAIYSLIQYNSVVIIQYYYGFPGDFHYMYWDTCCNFVFFLTFGYTGTSNKLTKQAPNCSLFTWGNISQLMIIFLLQMVGQFIMIEALFWYMDDIGYSDGITKEEFEEGGQEFITNSFQNNILFMYTNFIYVFTLLAFSISRPWRKEFYTNVPFTILLVCVLALSTVLVLVPDSRPSFLELDRIGYHPLLVFVVILSWGVGLFLFILQKYVLEGIFNRRKLKKESI